MGAFSVGDQVRVRNTRVHIHTGRVTSILPVRVRVTFPTGGYGGRPYVEDFPVTKLELLAGGTGRKG